MANTRNWCQRVKYSGGSAPVHTISDKQVVAQNKYFLSSDFDTADKTEEQFKWAQTSAEAKLATDLQRQFLEQVREVKMVAVKAKESVKFRKFATTMKTLELVNQYWGPVTADCLQHLDTLTEEQIISEVKYLKLTVAPDLKLKKRMKDPNNNRFKFVKLPREQLIRSIQGVVKPEAESGSDLDVLLAGVFD